MRHAPTAANANGRVIRGQAESPVTPQGYKIADLRARRFLDMPISEIRHTNTQRGAIMAEALQRYTGAPIQQDYRLKSWDLGDFEGQLATPAVEKQILNYMTKDKTKWVPGGEPYLMFLSRLLPFIRGMAECPEVICVTHSRCFIAIAAWDAAGRSGLETDPAVFAQKDLIQQFMVVEVTPDSYTPLVVEDIMTVPKAI